MTVIAWDGKTLAADRLACNGQTKTITKKIHRVGDCLVATCGDLSVGMELIEWFKSAPEKEFPAANRDPNSGASLIVIRHDRTVFKYESSPVPFQIFGDFVAFGSGGESAMIAMACGRNASQAVALASEYNITCGGGMDTLEPKQLRVSTNKLDPGYENWHQGNKYKIFVDGTEIECAITADENDNIAVTNEIGEDGILREKILHGTVKIIVS